MPKHFILVTYALFIAVMIQSVSGVIYTNDPFKDSLNLKIFSDEAGLVWENENPESGFLFANAVGGNPEDDFDPGSGTDFDDGYNDEVPLDKGNYILIFLVFVYTISKRLMKKRKSID
jgi:hypothetical protein